MGKYKMKVSLLGVILIVLMLYASISVSAADVYIDAGEMDTECSGLSQTATADAYNTGQDVDYLDEVFINISCYADDISQGGDGSRHYFKLTVEYPPTVFREDEWEIDVDPGYSHHHELSIKYDNVAGNELYKTSVYCNVTDLDSPFGFDEASDTGSVILT